MTILEMIAQDTSPLVGSVLGLWCLYMVGKAIRADIDKIKEMDKDE